MKKLLFCLIFISICLANNIYAQQKTPYEKKKEEISIKFLKKMGITQDKINQAKELGDMGLILLMGQAIQNMEAKDPMEALAIMNEFDKEIKATEKLKTEEDFRKERLKQEEKANRIKADQAKYEQQKQLEEKHKEELRVAEIYNNSDYVTVQKEIKTVFDKWMTKGEYEKTEEYDYRILNKEFVLDSLAYRIITLKMYSILYKKEVVLGQYNADLEIFPLEFKLNNNVSLDSIHVDRNSASNFKEKYKYYSDYGSKTDSVITVYRELRNWIFLNNQLFPNRYKINGKKEFVNLPQSGNIKQITFTTEELGLSNYFINTYNFNAIEYEKNYEKRTFEIRKKKYDELLIEAFKSEEKGEFNVSIQLLNKASDLLPDSVQQNNNRIEVLNFKINEVKRDKLIAEAEQLIKKGLLIEGKDVLVKANKIRYSEDINLKIEDLNYKINEIKRDGLIQQAQDFNSKGMLTKSIEKYNEANKIRQSQDITSIISEIEKTRSSAIKNHYALDSLYKLVTSEDYELFKDLVMPSQLDLIKEGYGLRYSSCETTLYKKLGAIWDPLSNEYESFRSHRNKEIWNEEYKTLLENMIQFDITFKSYMVFESRIYKALLESDKKYLKVFKEDDDNEIIETVIKTEN